MVNSKTDFTILPDMALKRSRNIKKDNGILNSTKWKPFIISTNYSCDALAIVKLERACIPQL